MLLQPVKVSNVRFYTRMTVPWSISTARNGWGMARYGSCHWCVPITETNCKPIVSGEITTLKKKKYVRARVHVHTTEREDGGWKLPDSDSRIKQMTLLNLAHSAYSLLRFHSFRDIIATSDYKYIGWFSSVKKVKWDATYRTLLFLFNK